MPMGGGLAVAAMGLHDHDVATCERFATETAPDIIQTPDPPAPERTQDGFGVLRKRGASYLGHGHDDRAIDEALMQHLADWADPVVDVDCGASEAQRRFTTHRSERFACPTVQTAVLDIAPLFRLAAPEQLLHEAIVVARIIARREALNPCPVLGKDLCEDIPVPRRWPRSWDRPLGLHEPSEK